MIIILHIKKIIEGYIKEKNPNYFNIGELINYISIYRIDIETKFSRYIDVEF